MSDIWKVIAELGIEMHPDRIAAVADKIASLESLNEFEKGRASFAPAKDQALIKRLGDAWKGTTGLTPLEISAALRAASITSAIIEERETVEMVWTGPSTALVASRHTEQVLLEVICSATTRLFLVSFVAYDIGSVMKALQDSARRNVQIDILLESSKSHGGKVDIDSIDVFLKEEPSANIYTWSKAAKSNGEWYGAVHAKCAVADGNMAFITSANLTRAAMERNMELGVLVRGGILPNKLERHLEALVTTGVLELVQK